MSTPVTDEELAARALAKDKAAFSSLYERYFDKAYDLAVRVVASPDQAADIAQDAFLKLLQLQGAPPTNFRAWFYTIVRHQAIDALRKKRGTVALPSAETDEGEELPYQLVEPGPGPEELARDEEIASLVWEAARGLSAGDYTVLDLHLRKGLEAEELAQVLNTSRGNVYTMLSRLKDSFEESLTTLLLQRQGKKECPELANLFAHHETRERQIDPALRRRVMRHVAGCQTCQRARRRYVAAAELLAAVPPISPLSGLREQVLGRLLEKMDAAPGQPGAGSEPGAPAWTVGSVPRAASAGTAASKGGFWASLGVAAKAAIIAGLVLPAIGLGLWLGATVFRQDRVGPPAAFVRDFALVASGSDGFTNTALTGLRFSVSGEASAWLLTEEAGPPPAAADPRWTSVAPASFRLSSGDGPKEVRLWVKDINGQVSTEAAVASIFLDTQPPRDPRQVFSSSHTVGQPSVNNVVEVRWTPAEDLSPGSGVDGYSVEWNANATAVPDEVKDIDAGITTATSPLLAPGSWYFHLSTLDKAGNRTRTVHLGPFVIISPPGPISRVTPTTTATRTPVPTPTPPMVTTPTPELTEPPVMLTQTAMSAATASPSPRPSPTTTVRPPPAVVTPTPTPTITPTPSPTPAIPEVPSPTIPTPTRPRGGGGGR